MEAGDAEHPTGALDDVLASGGRVYVAEVDGATVGVSAVKLLESGVCAVKLSAAHDGFMRLDPYAVPGRAIGQRPACDLSELPAFASGIATTAGIGSHRTSAAREEFAM